MKMKISLHFLSIFAILTACGWTELIINQVPNSLLNQPGNTNFITNLPDYQPAPTRKRPASIGDRWEKFEAEFGITEKESSAFKSSLQSAKYQLDHTTFAAQEFVHHVESLLRFDFLLQDMVAATGKPPAARGSSGSILLDTFNETRFKSNIDLRLSSRQFVGVKLVIPLRN